MDKFKIQITKSAENDLRDIARYLSAQLNAPITAFNMLQMIKKSIAELKTAALIHSLVRDDRLAALGYRQLIIKNYIVFYIVNQKEKVVFIERIIHGRRDWKNIL